MKQLTILSCLLLSIVGLVVGTHPAPPSFSEDVETFDLLVHEHGPLISFAQQNIEKTTDIIKLLKEGPQNPLVDKIIDILSDQDVQRTVDKILVKYPELTATIRGIRLFLTGPEAKPLFDAIKTVIAPLTKALLDLYEKIKGALEETTDIFVEEGVKLYMLMRTPEVITVVQKFQRLPEVLRIAEYLKQYDVDLMEGLKKLEDLLK